MAKYFLSFVLLAMLALENNNFYYRVYARSQSDSAESPQSVAHYMRSHQHHQHHLHLHHSQLPHHIRKQSQRHKHNQPRAAKAPHPRIPMRDDANGSDEDAAAAALRRYIHLQRHMVHQQQHLREHEQQFHHESVSEGKESPVREQPQQPHGITSTAEPLNLRHMPRLWQHLRGSGDRMYGDAPSEYSGETQAFHDEMLPPMVQEVNSYAGASNTLHESAENALDADDVEPHRKRTTPKSGCPKCESSRRVEHISEEELTQLRIEFVKQQILEKLRLKERPNVSAVGLPKPIYEGTTIEEEDDPAKNKDLDDYYARTSKKFIFLQRGKDTQRILLKKY